MRRAAAQGAGVVQFPEGALSGYAKEQIGSWDDVDWELIGGEIDRVLSLARELGIWVLLGSAHRLNDPHRPHNSMYVISDNGTIVDRYDKRICSNTEINDFYSPGFDAAVFEVDGVRFGVAVCLEVNFPELFAEYERAQVDGVLLSAYPVDSMFATKARAHAAINNYWIGLSAPAQARHLCESGLIGPDGRSVSRVLPQEDFVVSDIDTNDPAFDVSLNLARPWRAQARLGDIYRRRRVDDPRSHTRTGR